MTTTNGERQRYQTSRPPRPEDLPSIGEEEQHRK
jgi:hypothetical protein